MKKYFYTLLTVLFISSVAFAQKKELKEVEKSLKNGDVATAKTNLENLSSLITNADDKYKAQYHFLKGKVYYDMARKEMDTDASYQTAIQSLKELIAFEEKTKQKYTAEAQTLLQTLSAELVNAAIKDNETKKYDAAAKKLYMAYQLDTNNQDYLYYAASSAVSAKDYKMALDYYLQLKELKYTGETTQYIAVNKETNKEEIFPSQIERDLMIKGKSHIKPTEKKTESKFPEIVKNIALIYNQQGDTEKAIKAVKEARASNPNDINLLLTEADLYIKLGDKDKFKTVIQEAIKLDPNNPVLYFNLAVISGEQGNTEEAKEYYEKSIALNPEYKDSYMNLAALTLEQETAIVDEMNDLGTSRADNKRYDELKTKRENLYKSAVPYLEKILEIDPKNVDALNTLKNIYGTIGDNAKYKETKTKLEALGE